jgi:hypothetical protein
MGRATRRAQQGRRGQVGDADHVNERALARMLSEQLAAQRVVASEEAADKVPISGLN